MITVGSTVLCAYVLVFPWTNQFGQIVDEQSKGVAVKCKVLEVSPEYADLAPNYHHLKLDCSKGFEDYNIVKNLPMHWKIGYRSTDECVKEIL